MQTFPNLSDEEIGKRIKAKTERIRKIRQENNSLYIVQLQHICDIYKSFIKMKSTCPCKDISKGGVATVEDTGLSVKQLKKMLQRNSESEIVKLENCIVQRALKLKKKCKCVYTQEADYMFHFKSKKGGVNSE
jgi:hypothetical protein